MSTNRFTRTPNHLTTPWWRGAIGRAVVILVLAATAALATHATAAASCAIGYSTDSDRINAAYDDAGLIVTGTVVALDDRSQDNTAALPLTVATIAVDTNYRNTADPHAGTVLIANPANTSITRTFTLGQRYFVAARTTQGDTSWDTDAARWAPYLDNICTPTIEASALTPAFFTALNERLPAQSFIPREVGPPPPATVTNANNDTSTTPLIIGATLIAIILGTGFALWWWRRTKNAAPR